MVGKRVQSGLVRLYRASANLPDLERFTLGCVLAGAHRVQEYTVGDHTAQ